MKIQNCMYLILISEIKNIFLYSSIIPLKKDINGFNGNLLFDYTQVICRNYVRKIYAEYNVKTS